MEILYSNHLILHHFYLHFINKEYYFFCIIFQMKTGKVQVVIKDVCKITENILENNSY